MESPATRARALHDAQRLGHVSEAEIRLGVLLGHDAAEIISSYRVPEFDDWARALTRWGDPVATQASLAAVRLVAPEFERLIPDQAAVFGLAETALANCLDEPNVERRAAAAAAAGRVRPGVQPDVVIGEPTEWDVLDLRCAGTLVVGNPFSCEARWPGLAQDAYLVLSHACRAVVEEQWDLAATALSIAARLVGPEAIRREVSASLLPWVSARLGVESRG